VQDGLFEVSQQDEKGETVFSTLVGAGQVLGEMAAGNEGVRTASAKAMRDSRVLVFDPTDQTYERADAGDKQELTVTLAEVAHLRQTQGGWWGDAVPRLQRHAQLLGYTLSVPQAQFVLNLAAARVYKKGDVLIRQGDEVGEAGAPLFILGRGQFGFARTVSNRTGTGTFQPGDVVGGGGFLGRVPARTATITALEDSSIAYEIGPQHLAALNAQAFPFIQMVTALENRRRVG
jgi:CRP-like cAMP-binding protein